MIVDDQFPTYDLSLCIVMSNQNIILNAEMMSAFPCNDSGFFRSSMYAGSCVYISFPGSPGSRE